MPSVVSADTTLENAAPVRIRRGAFADNVPHRDLLLSPEHCILADGRLIAAKCR